MFRFLLRALLVIFAFRILLGLGRFLARLAGGRVREGLNESGVGGPGVEGGRNPGPGGPGRPRHGGELPIDRSSAIDVPFTEEDRDSKREIPLEPAVPGDGPGTR